jgi:superfamily I DNA/RNA helicase
MSDYFKDLNPEQTDAVKAVGNVLITACPGSGKTRVITHKLAFELEKVQGRKRMLVALTYTNRAADEIRRRIERMNMETGNLWSGTIHAFCLEWIIKPYEGYIPETANGFVIADEIESEEIIRALKEKYGVSKYTTIKRIYKLDGTFDTDDVAQIGLIKEYKSIIHGNKKIDFDDILFFSYKLITYYPVIAVRLSNLFELICVDEYQDTQELQYAILAQIVKAQQNKTRLFFVGDVSQAIYGSLGGVAKGVEEIEKQFGGIHIEPMKLTGNYRSTQRIVDYFSNYQIQPGKIVAVSSIAKDIGLISYNKTVNKNQVDEAIAKLIRSALDRKIPPEEICVMAPQWWMILPMGRKLKSLLPDVDFDAFGLSPFRKVRDNSWFKLIRLFLTTPGNSNYMVRHKWAGDVLAVFDDFFPSFLQHIENRKRYLLRRINHFNSDETDSLSYIRECLDYFARELFLPVDAIPLLQEARRIFDESVRKELEKAEFDYAREIKVLRRVFNSKSGVVVSTCHGVKGEEYDTVIAFGLLDGYIPNWGDPDKLASNKLLYVICSRAKRHLYLIAERGHTIKFKDRSPTPILNGVRFSYDPSDLDE